MRLVEFETKVDEAMPMGGFQRLGQTIRSKLPGLGASMAAGKVETGKLANSIIKEYYKYLGQQGQKPTAQSLLQFLNSRGYPTTKASEILRGLAEAISEAPARGPRGPRAPKIPMTKEKMNAAIMAAASEYIEAHHSAQQAPSASQGASQKTQAPSAGTGPSLAQSFAAGLRGRPAPGGGAAQPTTIDFSKKRPVQSLLKQLDTFQKNGGKLDPNLKAAFNSLIAKL